MNINESFEDWWLKRGHLYPAELKAGIGVAFRDGWYRSRKATGEAAVMGAPCGHSEPETNYCDPDTGEPKSRTAKCEGRGRLVIRGNGLDSFTDGTIFISSRACPKCVKEL